MHKIEYPKWKYCKTGEAKIVQDANEDADLGPEWAESPTAFDEEAKQTPKTKKSKKEE